MAKNTIAETQEIVPRYYGLSFFGEGNFRIFDSPSTSALAYVHITSPYSGGGLIDMLGEWKSRKVLELEGKMGYDPLFKLSARQAKKLLGCSFDRLVEIVREAVKKNHGSYNLWEASGHEAVSDLFLRGETLNAEVKSQREGKYKVGLKGAVRGRNGEIRYSDSNCSCDDNYWIQSKGGQKINVRRNCLHIKAAELDSYFQDTRTQPTSRILMKEKEPHPGGRSITFNLVDDPFLRPLIMDVFMARELLGESAYSIDRKLLSPHIGPSITPLSLQEEVVKGKAIFDVIKQKRRTRKIDSDVLAAQRIISEAFGINLRRAGYLWSGHCVELGREADRYENGKHAVSIVMGELPFYVLRSFEKTEKIPVFYPDYAPQDPFKVTLVSHLRVDDRTRRKTSCVIEPAVRISVPEISKPISLRYDLPTKVIEGYRREIREKSERPESILKVLRIKY